VADGENVAVLRWDFFKDAFLLHAHLPQKIGEMRMYEIYKFVNS
jgi:hypothetical protein